MSPGGTIVLNTTSAPLDDDLLDGLAVVGVIEREVLLADDLAAVRRDDLADLLVQDVRPDVVGRRQVERLRPRALHQPGDQRLDLLRRHRAGAEDERVALLPLVLLGVDVERLALHDGGTLDGLPRGAVDAAEDHVDVVLLDELRGLGLGHAVGGRAVLEVAGRRDAPAGRPRALMSSITILATFALAMPMNDSGPVWSVMTPTLMGSDLMILPRRSPILDSDD